jgi:hypothetical protein
MDYGIAGRTAIVCGASQGLGGCGLVLQPEEFGKACAFLCSAHAGFIVGQNLLLDGGAVNVTM